MGGNGEASCRPPESDLALGSLARTAKASLTARDSAAPTPHSDGREEMPVVEKLRAYGEQMARRNDLIREADADGIEEARIARLMGHSRTTIRTVLGRK
ncbi:hypothetical protein [Streptomyces luteolus]|uniref:Uncharacterized protein n=1 Tax=Streptomyces luteolus TaxID=3043615 RepID=A0ABT6SSJ8_9ACTN|nr:hypothetical protein [Streptomyces sp. B-S-A12]MDI3418579.1 hypothetical protein [Streptomyces sp. B-S-A12]